MLIWLLTLRLGLHGMHGLRVFLAHLLYRRPPKLKVDDAANESGISDIDTSTEDLPMTPSTIICGLCREYMQPPTSIPCGHIYCWNCLLSLCASGAGGTSVACPSCRQAFKPQSIRVLYDY